MLITGSIPTEMNNNKDIVSQAMEMSNISSDITMDFWLDYEMNVCDKLEAWMKLHFEFVSKWNINMIELNAWEFFKFIYL